MIYRRNIKFDESSLLCRIDISINRAIRFSKDDSQSGQDEDDYQHDIFRPTAGAANDRIRATDEPDTDPDDQYTLGGDIPDDIVSDTVENDGLQQHALPVKDDISYVPLSSYYYTDGSGPSVPEPEKNWHVK